MTPILGIVVPLKLNEKTQRRLRNTLAIPMITNLLIIIIWTIFFLHDPFITPDAHLLLSIPWSVAFISIGFKFIANAVYALIGKYIWDGTYPAIKKIHTLPNIAGAFQCMGLILDALLLGNVVFMHQENLNLDFAQITCFLLLLEFTGTSVVYFWSMKFLCDVQMIEAGMTVLDIKYQKIVDEKKDSDYISYII
ncbi:hypothetical protein CAEBREN_13117 [Caenorhabditis brenneri]|uniref:Uncharacterized protein n=1 Tax=Caenorhabditis brenneri TaxID=135651 RepID=G0NM15_CAEBE|nr:hypothetical protein CAEBREN_13117 [Caenorhabditis brenneri]